MKKLVALKQNIKKNIKNMTMNKLPADRPTNSVTALKAKALKQTEWLLLRRCNLSNIGDRVRNK